jgi:hypothetical protein
MGIGCQVCPYTSGTDYLYTRNITQEIVGWRNIGITGIFVVNMF